MFECFSLSFVTSHSALQKKQIGRSLLYSGAIKMRGPDKMRAGNRLWRVMKGGSTRRDVHSFLRGHFLTNDTIHVMLKSGLGASDCNQ